MKEYDDKYDICPHCGYIMSADIGPAYQLSPGTMIGGRYWIGMVLGMGGFGITYKAFDTKLNVIVAIKEYYPMGLVKRDRHSTQITYHTKDQEEEFHSGLHRFLEEARNLAKFSKHPNIVDVFHFFKENGTGYIVMEYLDGVSMKYFLKVNEGQISVLYAKEIVLAIAEALKALHATGILHRDVSPDNIFLCSNGKIKLIDFGASRLSVTDESSREVIVKPGYAPPEQYYKDEKQGPWTDIYGLGATFYCAVTGCVPPEAAERLEEDTLLKPSEWNDAIPAYIDAAILKAMALDAKSRFQKIQDFSDVLTKCKVVSVPKTKREKKQQQRRFTKCACSIAMFVLFVVLAGYYQRIGKPENVQGEISIWLCAEEGENAETLKAYYEKISRKLLEKHYPQIKVTIQVEEETYYRDRLLQALQEDAGPVLFESMDTGENLQPYACDLTKFVDYIEAKDNYYFLSDYTTYISDEKRLPVGFEIPVFYVLQKEENDNSDFSVPSGEIETEYIYRGEHQKEILQQFLLGEIPFLYATTSDYKEIMTAYDSFVSANRVNGTIHIYSVNNSEDSLKFTSFSINNNISNDEKKMAELYLEYLLSYEGQQLLYMETDSPFEALCINCRADTLDRKDVRRKLSVLDTELEHYQ
ncbi:MAG: protein kinase [Lachnospiraceae bacterium]